MTGVDILMKRLQIRWANYICSSCKSPVVYKCQKLWDNEESVISRQLTLTNACQEAQICTKRLQMSTKPFSITVRCSTVIAVTTRCTTDRQLETMCSQRQFSSCEYQLLSDRHNSFTVPTPSRVCIRLCKKTNDLQYWYDYAERNKLFKLQLGHIHSDTSAGYGVLVQVKLIRVERSRSLVQAQTLVIQLPLKIWWKSWNTLNFL